MRVGAHENAMPPAQSENPRRALHAGTPVYRRAGAPREEKRGVAVAGSRGHTREGFPLGSPSRVASLSATAIWTHCPLTHECQWMPRIKNRMPIQKVSTCQGVSSMPIYSALDLPVPRNLTALMQHLQRLVGREHHPYWCGGTVPVLKLEAFVSKMQDRYPILRNTRERSYDRHRGRAAMHLVVYPLAHGLSTGARAPIRTPEVTPTRHAAGSRADPRLAWWLLSGEGSGGLRDASVPDAHVTRDAMSAEGHITVLDYVLVYAHKREPRLILDSATGQSRTILKDCSTWTWKLGSEVMRALRVQIDECCAHLEYGAEPTDGAGGWGLRGLLASLRSRPLFSGVRTQVLGLHRDARDAWDARRPLWLAAHPKLATRYGEHAGALRPINAVITEHLPKMTRTRIYTEPPRRIRDLLRISNLQ